MSPQSNFPNAPGASNNHPAPQPPTHLLYLHGFRSSPQSAKARHVAAWMARHAADVQWCCPQLPPSPAAAMDLIAGLTADWPDTGRTAVIGSSLGGYYAAALAAARGWRSVLLNPAVDPARDLAAHLGPQTLWHDPQTAFTFHAAYIDELRAIGAQTLADEARRAAAGTLAPSFALICEGDEVLDWREMRARYHRAHQTVLPGNDHGISDFDQHWPALAHALGWG